MVFTAPVVNEVMSLDAIGLAMTCVWSALVMASPP